MYFFSKLKRTNLKIIYFYNLSHQYHYAHINIVTITRYFLTELMKNDIFINE